jgi:hypothetical protein
MHPKQLKVYKIKAAFLEKRGWVTYYHYNNWINPNYISHNDKSIPSLGITIDEACEYENYYHETL